VKRLLLFVILLLVVCAAGATWFYLGVNRPYKGYAESEQFVEIPPGSGTAAIARRLADAGVKFGFGTDAGVPTRVPAYLDHEEIQLMAQAGLTPMQIITAATKSGAEFLGARDLGTLERGKWADLVVLDADPLSDLKNTRKISAVYIAGNKAN